MVARWRALLVYTSTLNALKQRKAEFTQSNGVWRRVSCDCSRPSHTMCGVSHTLESIDERAKQYSVALHTGYDVVVRCVIQTDTNLKHYGPILLVNRSTGFGFAFYYSKFRKRYILRDPATHWTCEWCLLTCTCSSKWLGPSKEDYFSEYKGTIGFWFMFSSPQNPQH